MTIHSAADHGYHAELLPITVRPGDLFRERCAVGVSEYRVLGRHRDAGYFETAMVRWVTEPDHPSRQSRVGSIQIRSETEILRLLRAA